jgi:molybdopterin converting factor subunit 1
MTQPPHTVEVKLFALAAERAGARQVAVELPPQSTVADLRRHLGNAYPALAPLLSHVLFAIDAQYAADTTPIPAGAELACIPPVSGG